VAEHVDLYRLDWHTGSEQFVRWLSLDDPMLVTPRGTPTQVALGRATYFRVSEPHAEEACPHGVGS
jgi:hypothetical protein